MQFVIFHGAFGSKDGNWFPWLKKELIKRSNEVMLEQFPVEDWKEVEITGQSFKPIKQTLSNWYKTFEKKILPKLKNNKKLCFIGHSLGPVFILHLIERYNLQLDSAIFIMPFLTSLNNKDVWMFDIVNDSFYKDSFDFKKLKKLIPYSYVIYSDNDIVPQKMCLDFAKKLNSKTFLIKGAKHINTDSGYTQLPLVLDLCKSRIKDS